MRDLVGKAVLITGAASGIGRAAALAFARQGSDPLLLNDIDEAGLADVAREVELLGRTAVALPADVSDAAAVLPRLPRARHSISERRHTKGFFSVRKHLEA